ncbi:hypothetical protein [Nocardia sp. bgisy118]|uniref:hypothetical protein n=1 Tax=Nocardia sp. bgisy118 TaxID=3413786 RepID=UPI003F4A2560
MVARVEHVLLDDLADLDHITALGRVMGWIGAPQDIASTTAKRLDWPVLTLEASRWQPIDQKLPWQVPVVEPKEP